MEIMEKYLLPIYSFLQEKEWFEKEDDFIDLQYEIVDKMEEDNIGFEAVNSILSLMEKNPLVEFGTPGPLTHFIEKFHNKEQNNYGNLLENSVKETPTVHTVWLLNRLLNGSDPKKSNELLSILNSISTNKEIHQEIRNVANNFIEYHQKN